MRKHNFKLSPLQATINATDAYFLGHTISPARIMPNEQKVEALREMPMPQDIKQLRSFFGGLSYLQELLPAEKRVSLIQWHGLRLGGPSAVRVSMGGPTSSDPSSTLDRLPLSSHHFQDFCQHSPRMGVDDLDAPPGQFVARAPLDVAWRGPTDFPVEACASDSLAASVFGVPAAPLSTSADDSEPGLHAVSSEFSNQRRKLSLLLSLPTKSQS